ncbi:hypothetical protein [Muribaculum intestinale]|uniref:hypothetical protein n=1 Tax=Muribaculum intestinale TaxID=1796646 RepID=UPI00260680A5|nr:hypothetical protein [Muribaculum intestinale]
MNRILLVLMILAAQIIVVSEMYATKPDSTKLNEVDIMRILDEEFRTDTTNLRYYLWSHTCPDDSLKIDPNEIYRQLESAISLNIENLDFKSWYAVKPYMGFLVEVGWRDSDYFYWCMGQKSIQYKKSYVEEAYLWAKEHEKQLTRKFIYDYLRLWYMYIDSFKYGRSGDLDRWEELSDSILVEKGKMYIK